MIKKALITSAGFGTRLLPITKTIQKEMLPILNRPIIDYIVKDCIDAGITEIIFVVKESENKLVEHFYTEYRSIKQHLEKMGKLNSFQDQLFIHENIKFRFVTQTIADRYGTAIPVELAKKHLIDEEAFLVFMGDDFIFNADERSEAKQMIDLFYRSNSKGLVTCITKPDEELNNFGVAEIRTENGFTFLTNLVEKPKFGEAPSNLINISKYIFTPEIFDIIANQKPNKSNNEYYITDSATILAQNNNVSVYTPRGRYLDGELDMRMDNRLGVKAKDLLALIPTNQLEELFREFGGENDARRIAKAIKNSPHPITTTKELSNLIINIKGRQQGKLHPATKVFQALRIAVNTEIENIMMVLPQALELLNSEGRIVTIAFHEGEDREVKNTFKLWEQEEKGENLSKNPIIPTNEEIKGNSRSRSAKMRIFIKK